MTDQELKSAPKIAWMNRKTVQESQACGCYQCLAVVSTEDIVTWTDDNKTALCPECGCDCLVPQSHGLPLDRDTLSQLKQYWFGD